MPSIKETILPGSTIGILGSGQLGRMSAIAAKSMGYRVHVYSPESGSPAGQVADMEFSASYEDKDMLRRFAENIDVATWEFENIPVETVRFLEEFIPVRPGADALFISQNRLREKSFISEQGLPVAPFYSVCSREDLFSAINYIGYPAVFKTAGLGYDGKGQVKISSEDQVPEVINILDGNQHGVLESFVNFEKELSVVAALSADGSFAHYGVIENVHRNHVLDISFAPASISPKIEYEAIDMAKTLINALDIKGILCVEFFLTGEDKLLINEIAPRTHNSGHLTIESACTSQFEQHIRTICGLPLGSTRLLYPAAMVNIMGDLWKNGEPSWNKALALPDTNLHLYGKYQARPGRKMGHITAISTTSTEASNLAIKAREALLNRVLNHVK